MNSLNKVSLIGRLGKDPDVREVSGVKVATFTMATSEGGYRKSDGTEVPEKTQWHSVVLWRGLAEVAEKYLHKGDRVYVEGKISYRTYEKEGQKMNFTEIIGSDMMLMGSGGRKPDAGANPDPGVQPAPFRPDPPESRQPARNWQQAELPVPDDDLPF